MEEIKTHYLIEESREMSSQVEEIKSEWVMLKTRIKELHYEEENLSILWDSDLDFED